MKLCRRNYGLTLFGCVFAAGIACQPARAQGTMAAGQMGQAGQVGQANQMAQAPVFNLPPGVSKLVFIDAQNVLLAELTNGQYQLLTVQHVYSGGIARLFGGATIPTEYFVSPASNRNIAGGAAVNTGDTPLGTSNGNNADFTMGFGVGGFNP